MLSEPRKDHQRRPRGGVALLGTIGGYTLVFVGGGLMLGFFLDRALSTFPLFLLIGVFLGFGGSLVQIYRLAMRELKG